MLDPFALSYVNVNMAIWIKTSLPEYLIRIMA